MIFPNLREFRPRTGKIDEVFHYLSIELVSSFKILTLGLTKLRIEDNFAGFIVEDLLIPAGQEVQITNRLGEPVTSRIILRGGDGAQNIVDGETAWTNQIVTLKNVGGVDATVKVAFLK